MGLGQLFERNINITQTDTVSGATVTDVIIAPPNQMGAYPAWQSSGPWQGGMTIPPAYRAAMLISGAAAGLPWRAYRLGEDDVPVRVRPDPPLLLRPGGRETRFETYRSTILDLLWNGNAIWLKTDDDDLGEPRSVLPVAARDVWVKRIEQTDQLATIPVGTVGYYIGGRWYHPDRVVHFKGPHEPGAVVGLGLVELFLGGTLELAAEHRRQAAAASGAGIPTGLLKSDNPDLTPAEAATLKAGWKASQATRDIAVLNATTSFESLAWNPTEAQLLEARQFDHVEIAQIFGVSAAWLDAATSSKSYANVEQEGIMLVRFGGLADTLEVVGETLAANLSDGTWVEPVRDKLLSADTLARYQAHQIGITAGFLAPSEARALENRQPMTPEQRAELEALVKMQNPQPPAPAAGGGPSSSGRQGPPAAGKSANQPAKRSADLDDGELERKGDADGSNLKQYWLHGPGLAKWATSPKPWTTLYHHLKKYIEDDDKAKRTASAWYHEHFGHWPSD